MHDHKIGCLPILDGEKLLGIITETDILDLFVDLFGVKTPGTRITLALQDAPGILHDVLHVLKKHNVNIISVVTPSYKVNGKRIVAIRIQTLDYDKIVEGLKTSGYEVLSIDKWPSN
jgi:acetoin utilization protein AcuB